MEVPHYNIIRLSLSPLVSLFLIPEPHPLPSGSVFFPGGIDRTLTWLEFFHLKVFVSLMSGRWGVD